MFRRLRSGLRDTRANVAVTVALSLAPLSLAALGALDIARATSAKLILQDALDAATLATAKTTASDPTQLQNTGDRILHQNLVFDSSVSLSSDTFVFGPGGTVVADASAGVRPLILGFITGGDIKVGAHTEVKRAGNELEIALVLDNTGSMAGAKINNLRSAATNFINSMAKIASQSSDPNVVKIALVPFDDTVNVGASYQTAAWMDTDGTTSVNNEIFTDAQGARAWANRFDLFQKMGVDWGGCVESRKAPYDIEDTPPSDQNTKFTPYFAPDEPDQKDPGDTGGGYNNNYMKDQISGKGWKVAQGYAGKYVAPKGKDFNSGKGPNKGCDTEPIQRLTTDWQSLKTAVSAMQPGSTTNIAMGLVWGWHTLSPNAPFSDGVAYATPKHKKIVILMTDGENTMPDNGPWFNQGAGNTNVTDYSGLGYLWQGRLMQTDGVTPLVAGTAVQRAAAMDERLRRLCANMKASGTDIEIYTMRVEVTGGTSTVLQDCASGADHYFDVQHASDLDAVFQQIAGAIASLHLSK